MARTPIYHEEKKAQIVQAALTTFSKYGYEGTTNKLLAQEAGKLMGVDGKPISPALIYHYFPEGKAELFAACLDEFPPIQRFAETIQANLEQPPEVFLRIVVHNYNSAFSTEGVLPIIRLILSEGQRHPELAGILLARIRPVLLPLASYFEKQRAALQLPHFNSDQVIFSMIGPIFMRRVMLTTIPKEDIPIPISSDEEFLERLAQTILKGLFSE